MALVLLKNGDQLPQARYIIDYNFQDIIARANDPVPQVSAGLILRVGGGMELGELRRILNENFQQLASSLGAIGLDVSLGSGDLLQKIKNVCNANFALLDAEI